MIIKMSGRYDQVDSAEVAIDGYDMTLNGIYEEVLNARSEGGQATRIHVTTREYRELRCIFQHGLVPRKGNDPEDQPTIMGIPLIIEREKN